MSVFEDWDCTEMVLTTRERDSHMHRSLIHAFFDLEEEKERREEVPVPRGQGFLRTLCIAISSGPETAPDTEQTFNCLMGGWVRGRMNELSVL